MNNAFEMILERLEESYINCFKLGDYKFNNGIDKAKQIVKEVAEEYNGGWIPCSEMLTKEYKKYLCCDKNGQMMVGYLCFGYRSYTGFSVKSDYEMMHDVIAWMPLPEPYQQKGE